jgi:uncharacterized protein (DUF433 family)
MTVEALPEPVPLAPDAHGTIRVAGTRVTLETIYGCYRRGENAEEIHEGFPTVSIGDIYAVLTYIVRHPDEMREYISRVEAGEAAARALIDARGDTAWLRERLRAHRNA